MDASMISRLESGRHAPDATDVDRLAEGLQLSVHEQDAMRLAYERDVLRRKALSSDTLISSADTLRLAREQVAVARRLRLAGRSEVAAASAAQTAQWVGMMARAAGSPPAQRALLQSLMDLLSEQFRGHLEHLLASYGSSAARTPRSRRPMAGQEVDVAPLIELSAVGRQAIEVGRELDEMPAWLLEAASDVAQLGLWAALEPDASGSSEVGPRVEALRTGLRDVGLGRQAVLADSLAALSVVLEGENFPGQAEDFLALHRANALRTLGRYRDAAALYEQLGRSGSAYGSRKGFWAADQDYLGGRFEAALESLEAVPDKQLRSESLRLRGHVYRVNALFGRALRSYRQAHELARQGNSPAMEARALTNVAETLSWTQPRLARSSGRRALISNRVMGNQVEVVKAHLALAVSASGQNAWEEARVELEAGRAVAEAIGYQGGLITAALAEAFQAHLDSRPAAIDRMYRQIEEATARLGGKAFWLDVLDAWLGRQPAPRAAWLGGAEAAASRWRRVLERRRRQ
jgi:tetratricopeptide (TPR) repeat protein